MARDADGHGCGITAAFCGGNMHSNWDGRLDETEGVYDPDHDYDPPDDDDKDD